MKIPPFKNILQEKVKAYVDPFELRHERNMKVIKKEKQIEKRYVLKDAQEKNLKAIAEEKIVLKQNNERWKQLNIIS